MKKIIIGIMVGLIISCTVGVLAASIVPSSIVTYQDKTVNTALDELYDSVNLLKTKGNAEANQILTGKKVIVKGQEITGTMANRGNLNWNPSSSTSYTVPAGYYSGGTLNSSGSYNAGYSVGVAAADNRANPSSVNYKTGYNAGVVSGKNLVDNGTPIAIGWVANRNCSNTNAVDIWVSYNKNLFTKNGVQLIASKDIGAVRMVKVSYGETLVYENGRAHGSDIDSFSLSSGSGVYVRPGSDYSGWSTCVALYKI